jgi:hypothetical protein
MQASTYLAVGRTEEAVAVLEDVVEASSTTLVETHPRLLASKHELAVAYLASGRLREAAELLEYVILLKSRVFPVNHPSRMVSQELAEDMMVHHSDPGSGTKV